MAFLSVCPLRRVRLRGAEMRREEMSGNRVEKHDVGDRRQFWFDNNRARRTVTANRKNGYPDLSPSVLI